MADRAGWSGLGALLLALAQTMALSVAVPPAFAQSFDGSFEFRWTSEPGQRHRIMETLTEVSFTDKSGKRWVVPAGTPIDGASIPPVLWTFAGSPFVGNYRRASVIHDRYCDTRTEPASKVHTMFREAMEADGVPPGEAWSKYLAVSVFGSGCGRRENAIAPLARRVRPEGFFLSERLLSELRRYELGDALPPTARAAVVGEVGQIENSRTYRALVAFRADPSQQNYEEIQASLEAEGPSEAELDELILLTLATLPEIEPPPPPQ